MKQLILLALMCLPLCGYAAERFVGGDANSAPPSPQQIEPSALRSQPSYRSTSITFINELDRPVTVIWIDFDGNEKVYNKLEPGQSYVQQTYTTHAWIVRENQASAIRLTIVGSDLPQVARIGK